jgi:excisionase family DNA binding protein
MPTHRHKSEVVQSRNRDSSQHAERLLTIPETAQALSTSERHVRRLVAERRLGYTKVGYFVRVPQSAIDEFVAAATVEPVR